MPSKWFQPFKSLYSFIIIIVIVVSQICFYECLQVEGYWSPLTSPLKVVARFGIQKSEPNHKEETSGYAFGNITLISHPSEARNNHLFGNSVMLFVNRTLFKQIYHIYSQYYGENVHLDVNKSKSFCERIYDLVEDKFDDHQCSNQNHQPNSVNKTTTTIGSSETINFVRYVPCQTNRTCTQPTNQAKPLTSYQFTYVIDNRNEPTFWFLLLLSCQRQFISENISKGNNSLSNCTWKPTEHLKSLISYDIWLVNGHPTSGSNSFIDFDHQFSFEQQNLFIYIALNVVYLILLVVQLFALSNQKVRGLNWLFTVSLAIQCLAYFFFCLHKIVFAHNGKGFETLCTVADVMKIMSTALFMLFVLMIAKGYPITKQEIFSKTMLLIIWSIYTFIKIILYVWIKRSLNFIEEVDEYHTVPGWISLGFRIILMIWFLHELRHTMVLEHDSRKLRFYLHFGAGMLVWFVHLPLVAMVAMQIDLLWRYKIISGFSSAADIVAFAIVTRLMYQMKYNQFSSHHHDQSEVEYNDDLDYYDEVHENCTNSETIQFSKAAKFRSTHILQYDNLSCDSAAVNNHKSSIKT